jgi:adenosine deaminase
MKDVIVDAYPEVLGLLLNNVLSRYAKAGVQYIEFSVSAKCLLDKTHRKMITDNVFVTEYPRMNQKSSVVAKGKPAGDSLTFGEQSQEKGRVAKPKSEESVPVPTKALEQTPDTMRFFLPKVTTAGQQKPEWRNYLNDYHDKSGQVWTFLAAFNRTMVNPDYPSPLSAAPATGNRFTTYLSEVIGDSQPQEDLRQAEEYLYKKAGELISDLSIASMYLTVLQKIHDFLDEYIRSNEKQECPDTCALVECVAGIDWVGDEFGFPFCAFTHVGVLEKIVLCRKINPNFGIRIHAGEGLIRFSSAEGDEQSRVGRLFKFHLFTLMLSIKKIHSYLMDSAAKSENSKCHIRIGHGVAFLYKSDKNPDSFLNVKLDEFRRFLKTENIPCELNPTSNHMLIPATFGRETVTNDRSLTAFLKYDLPVVLCTDDDGVWAIRKCSCHYHHISVAHEFCDAIQRGEITSIPSMEKLISDGRNYSFTSGARSKQGDLLNRK